MNSNYFDFLEQNSISGNNPTNSKNNDDIVNLTVRVDEDCECFCDGEKLFSIKAQEVKKCSVTIGPHIWDCVSSKYNDVRLQQIIDYNEANKTYILLINGLKDLVSQRSLSDVVTIPFVAVLGGTGLYTGTVRNNLPSGEGIVEFDSGAHYEGEFKDGLRHGHGKHIFSNGEVYEGDFFQDIRTGIGRYTYSNGGIYEGEFKDGIRHGKGKFIYANGDTFEGEYNNDQIIDKSNIYIWANGDSLECEGWDNGPNGEGLYTYSNGKKEKQIWKHGRHFYEKNGVEYVDLGLPSGIKWAAKNIGLAESGDLFAWGETKSKTGYTLLNYKFSPYEEGIKKYYNCCSLTEEENESVTLDLIDDAAHVNYGTPWRMPTCDEWDELINNCDWRTENIDGKEFKVGIGPNGNSIKLPFGWYWLSQKKWSSSDIAAQARHIDDFTGHKNVIDCCKVERQENGLLVRAVFL